jgi:thiol-disulfide isomerase/thioredoxin
MVRFLTFIAIVFIVCSCASGPSEQTLKEGVWRGVLNLHGQHLPFNFEVLKTQAGAYEVVIHNAGERLRLDEISIKNDSVFMPLHIFDASLVGKISENRINGSFVRHYDPGKDIPFRAEFGKNHRFEVASEAKPVVDYSGKYRVQFFREKDTTDAVGVFKQTGQDVTGTFLTTTGDYRYLEGSINNDSLLLSAFDGNHAYLFKAALEKQGEIHGFFYSGLSKKVAWKGVLDSTAALPDAQSIVYLKEGHEKIDFTFPDINGDSVSLSDAKYKNKVVILQLFGTWCPNCMDETKFLAPWYEEHKERGVEIIGLAYERKDDFTYASQRVKTMIKKLNVTYDFVIAGTNDKEKASASLPMLNRIAAFPTTIFIGKDGKVKRIHTGFSGPGTGEYYTQYIEEFNGLINELLKEDGSNPVAKK